MNEAGCGLVAVTPCSRMRNRRLVEERALNDSARSTACPLRQKNGVNQVQERCRHSYMKSKHERDTVVVLGVFHQDDSWDKPPETKAQLGGTGGA